MTGPEPPGEGPDSSGGSPASLDARPESPGPRPQAPGPPYFTIEGRAAPGLFLVGWLASVIGLGVVVVAFISPEGVARGVLFVAGAALLEIGLVAASGAQAIERRTRGAAYAGPSPLLVFIATIPAAYLAAVAVGTPLAALGVKLGRPLATLLLVALQTGVNLGLVRLLVVGQEAISWREMGFGRRRRAAIGDLVWGASLAAPVILATAVLASVLYAIFKVAPDSPLPPTGTATGLALSLLAGAVLAPLGEEVLFRGVATTAWVRALGSVAGIVRAGLLFALAHILTIAGTNFAEAAPLAIVAFTARIPVSFVLGWAYVRRGSIWASIGLHATFNGFLIILAELAARTSG